MVFPIRDAQLCARLRNEILAAYLADTVKARLLESSGVYYRIRESEAARALPAFSSQDFFMKVAEGKASVDDIPAVAEPEKHPAKRPVKRAAAREKSAAD